MMDISQEDPRLGRALGAVAKAQQAQVVLAFLEEYLIGRQRQLDTQLFDEADEGKQLRLVRQKQEAHLFLRNLMQLLNAGTSAARTLQPMMDLPE